MWATITKPFAWLMVWLYNLTGSYALSIILFALAINLILSPFMAKSKKSTMRTSRLQPKIQELQRRHEGNQQKLNEEMQKLYREEGVKPLGGCLWSLIPFPILIALYSVIRQPLQRMMFVGQDVVDALTAFFTKNGWYIATENARQQAYVEIKLTDILHAHWGEVQSAISAGSDGFAGLDCSRLMDIDFSCIGLNLGDQPQWNIFKFDWSDPKIWLPALGLFLIPFLSAFFSWLSMKISTATNTPAGQTAQQEASMKSMNVMMPLMSVWFCFIMPAAMGVYWICNSIFGMARDYIFTKVFQKQLDIEDAERIAARTAREKELEEKRAETERLRAEGKTEKNANTSKKKIQAAEKQKADERKAALEKAERAARRERLGIPENEIPASQVGNRRYARGRAYVADRFTNPEAAEEATAQAEALSELLESIDAEAAEAVENSIELAAEAVSEAEE